MRKNVVLSLFLSLMIMGDFSSVMAQDNEIKKEAEVNNTIVLANNDKNVAKYEADKLLFMESQDDDTTLLFSDSPETVEKDGILYQDIVRGDVRLLYYHLNGMSEAKKVAVVIENMSSEYNQITLSKQAVAGPSEDYLYVGKVTMQRYFSSQGTRNMTLAPYSKTILHMEDNERIIPSGGLVYGIFDFHTEQNLKVSVIIAPIEKNLLRYVDYAPILPTDKYRLRGTYKGKERHLTNRNIYNPQKMGKAYFYIGDNKTDLYKYGIDKTDFSTTHNFGNYGVVYNFEPKLEGEGKTSYYLKPLGGVYAGAMAVKVGDDGEYKLISTPDELPFFGHEQEFNYYAYLGTYNNNEKISFLYTPPGASNLPVQMILIPEK